MKDLIGGFFLWACFFGVPLTVWIVRTGGL
jgi:hypothetical protein